MGKPWNEPIAKQFAAELIEAEAVIKGMALSETERKMRFSETGWTLPDIPEVAQHFQSEYDSPAFETKISALAQRSQERLGREDRALLEEWWAALDRLAEGDHYLLVLVGRAGRTRLFSPFGAGASFWVARR